MAIDPYMEHKKILTKSLADSIITALYNTVIEVRRLKRLNRLKVFMREF